MDIKKYLDNLLLQIGELDAVVLEISKTGSQLFKDGPKDQDYRVVCTGLQQRDVRANIEVEEIVYDFFIFDVSAIQAQQDFNDKYYIREYIKMFAYTTQVKEVIYGGFDTGWDMLEHEEEYKKFIKNAYDTTLDTIIRGTNYRHGKFYVNYYIILKIYENQIAEINEDMVKDIQTLYLKKDETRDVIIDWVIAELDKIPVT